MTTHTKIEVECICRCCGAKFYRNPSTVKAGSGQFCSRQCAMKSRMAMPYREKRIDGADPDRPLVIREVVKPVKRLKPGPRRR